MCTMSEMETEGTADSIIWLITKCLHNPENLQLPCKLCLGRGFTCGEDDKVFSEATNIERTQKKLTTRMTIPNSVSSLSEPDIGIIERSDLNYVHFFRNREPEELSYAHFVVFPLRSFLLPEFPALSLSSKALRYAMLSIYAKRRGPSQNTDHSLAYRNSFFSSIHEAIAEENFRDLAFGNYFMAYYALLEGSIQEARIYAQGQFVALETLIKRRQLLSPSEWHNLQSTWARTLGWVSIVYYGSFYPLQVDGWHFTPTPMKQLREDLEQYNMRLQHLFHQSQGPVITNCDRCLDHYNYYSLQLSFCHFLDRLHSNAKQSPPARQGDLITFALRKCRTFLGQLYCRPLVNSMILGVEHALCLCPLWAETRITVLSDYHLNFTDKYHMAYRHCFAATLFHILSESTSLIGMINAIELVRKLFGAITVTPWQRYFLNCPRKLFFAGLRLTWSVSSDESGMSGI